MHTKEFMNLWIYERLLRYIEVIRILKAGHDIQAIKFLVLVNDKREKDKRGLSRAIFCYHRDAVRTIDLWSTRDAQSRPKIENTTVTLNNTEFLLSGHGWSKKGVTWAVYVRNLQTSPHHRRKDIRGIENEVYGKRENIVADLRYTIRKIVLFIENTNILT